MLQLSGSRCQPCSPEIRHWATPLPAKLIHLFGGLALVMPDFMRIGGVTGWLRAAAIAGAAGVPISTHLYPEVAAHVMRVTETADWLEWQDWANPILRQPYKIVDGMLHIPDALGVGLEWNEDAVAANSAEL